MQHRIHLPATGGIEREITADILRSRLLDPVEKGKSQITTDILRSRLLGLLVRWASYYMVPLK